MAMLPSAPTPPGGWPNPLKPTLEMSCSFCGKTSKEKDVTLILGPIVQICNECVSLCVAILEERGVKLTTESYKDDGKKTT